MANEEINVLYVNPETDACSISAWRANNRDMWSFEFSFPKNTSYEKTTFVQSPFMYDTYQAALLAGYLVSEQFGYEKGVASSVYSWDEEGELVEIAQVSLETLAKWFLGIECPFCNGDHREDESITEAFAERQQLTVLH